MEFEDVSEKVQWESQRVAAAFGVEEWEGAEDRGAVLFLLGWVRHHCIRCFISYEPLRTYEIGVGKRDHTGTNFWHQEMVLDADPLDGEYDLMARGLIGIKLRIF